MKLKLSLGLVALFSITSTHAAGPLPVTLMLDKPGYVTAVISGRMGGAWEISSAR